MSWYIKNLILLNTFFILGNAIGEDLQPNIVIIMTDDQGYPELSSHGNPILQTPHLDDLASKGLRFSDFHSSPMCAPTRGQLLTGLDAARNGLINVSAGRALLRPEIPTMADLFKNAGWATGIYGKWHMGANYPFRPEDRGFQDTVWFPSSHIGSIPDYWGNDYFDDTYINNGDLRLFEGYTTDIFFNEAMRFIKQSADDGKPFLAYISTATPHAPLRAKDEDKAEIKKVLAKPQFDQMDIGLKDRLSSYLGMIRNIDTNVGKLVSFLEEEELRENTILVFMTDNGSILGHRYYNAGMRGMKTELWDGGHRVPLFISWPNGNFMEPKEIAGLAQMQDILPTLLDLSGIESNLQFDGISLANVLRGNDDISEDRMLILNYSRMPGFINYPAPYGQTVLRRDGAAVLWKTWRLLEDRVLFDLDSDPLQQTNVISENPEVLSMMRNYLYHSWNEVEPIVNEIQRVIIGSDHENPSKLSATEWIDVFVDQQSQVEVGVEKSGYWMLDVAETGIYEFELRRWPLELDRPITYGRDGGPEGQGALPITHASLYISDYQHLPIDEKSPYSFEGLTVELAPDDTAATFTLPLEKGPITLHTWFRGGPISAESRDAIMGYDTVLSAYYVYVTRK